MKVGWNWYVQNPENYAHNNEMSHKTNRNY